MCLTTDSPPCPICNLPSILLTPCHLLKALIRTFPNSIPPSFSLKPVCYRLPADAPLFTRFLVDAEDWDLDCRKTESRYDLDCGNESDGSKDSEEEELCAKCQRSATVFLKFQEVGEEELDTVPAWLRERVREGRDRGIDEEELERRIWEEEKRIVVEKLKAL